MENTQVVNDIESVYDLNFIYVMLFGMQWIGNLLASILCMTSLGISIDKKNAKELFSTEMR